jgi:NitT/TauT family transport system ATP-binding protein
MPVAEAIGTNVNQLEARSVGVSFGATAVLSDLSLTIRSREFVSIVGGSGTGKTTLLNVLAGFIPHVGTVTHFGHAGVVFQDHSVFPWLTVAQNIAFGLAHLPVKERKALVESHLELIQMTAQRNRYPAELSGGQVQRVGIARALAPKPDFIIMDEPYASVDRHTRDRMQNWLLDVWERNHTTVIFVTHDLEEAIYLSDRVLVLAGGRISEEFVVPFGRPRNEDMKFDPQFTTLKKELFQAINRGSASATKRISSGKL